MDRFTRFQKVPSVELVLDLIHVMEEEGGVRDDFQVSGYNRMNVSVFVIVGNTERQLDLGRLIQNYK